MSAWSAMPDSGSSADQQEDGAYAKGREAFDEEDWQSVIDHMSEVVEEKPWHDDAYSLLGFAYRKLGDFETSLANYDKALTLNPHNREALEYLGEAYLEMDRPERTEEVLATLALECQRVAARFANGDWRTGCEPWLELNAAYQAYVAGRPRPHQEGEPSGGD
ncbi:MAG: tetratricopeptide repeat protein [Alphaproteobacteria bacterium]